MRFKQNAGSSLRSDGLVRRKVGSSYETAYAPNIGPTSGSDGSPSQHQFWRYSLNPYFDIAESNYFNNINEFSFSTENSNPGSHGRYAAGLGVCNIYMRSGNPDGLSDCLIKPKFELNVVANGSARYRSRVLVTNSNPFVINARYFRLIIDAIRGFAFDAYVQLSEFSMLGRNNIEINGTYSNIVGSSPGSEGPSNLGDENLNTKWLNFEGDGSIVQIDFGTNVNVAGYRMATANDSDNRDPISWRVQSSSNGSTWTTIAQVQNFATPTARQVYFTEDQFSLVPTLLTGFWANTFSGGANLPEGGAKPSGLQTSWGPPVNFSRTVSLNTSGQPRTTWNASTNEYIWDYVLPFGNTFIRPIIKLQNKSFLGTEQSMQISEWEVSRTA